MLHLLILKKQKTVCQHKHIKSIFEEIISTFPQESIVGPSLFNIILMTFCILYQVTSVQNSAKKIENLISILESEIVIATNWFKGNHMIMNPGKQQAIIFDERMKAQEIILIKLQRSITKKLNRYQELHFYEQKFMTKRNFNYDINNNLPQINSTLERKALVNTFVMTSFNYSSLVWNFCRALSLNKMENVQKRALPFLLNDLKIWQKSLVVQI